MSDPPPIMKGYTITGRPGSWTATHDRIDLALHGADQRELGMRRAIAMADEVDAIRALIDAASPWGYPIPRDGGSAVSSSSNFEAERDHLYAEDMRRASQRPPDTPEDLPTADPQAAPAAGADSQADDA